LLVPSMSDEHSVPVNGQRQGRLCALLGDLLHLRLGGVPFLRIVDRLGSVAVLNEGPGSTLIKFKSRRLSLAPDNECSEIGTLGKLEEADGLLIDQLVTFRRLASKVLVPIGRNVCCACGKFVAMNRSFDDGPVCRHLGNRLLERRSLLRSLISRHRAAAL